MRFLIAFCLGIAAILIWQSYGDAARQVIANSYPQLAWLAPEAALAQTAPDTTAPPAISADSQELKAISLDLAAVRQRVDQLAFAQQQMTRDFTTKLQAAEQEILDKIPMPAPQPAAAAARKPVSPPLQVTPVR
jgi:small-conductance mechanosensitive channel